MSTIIIAAVLGFLWIEINAVNKALRANAEKFDLGYYFKKNLVLLLGNAVGTVLVYLMAPAITIFLRWFLEKWTEDAELIATMSDYVLEPITGASIGLFGSWFVRKMVAKGKSKVDPQEPTE